MNQLWQFWKTGLTNDQIDEIISVGNNYPIATTAMGFGGEDKSTQHRSSEIRWIPENTNPTISDLIWSFARTANRNAFGFDISYLIDLQYTTYYADNNGQYDWHHDVFWPNITAFDRKLSVVIQLSDSQDYEGGDFELDSWCPPLPAEDIRTKGAIIVFPSFLRHRVTPVTKGIRRSLVSWIEGAKFR
jgi:PKHD-type hydroxylase